MNLRETFNWSEPPLFLIDGTSFIYRAFYAYPDLSRSDGFQTNALFIVLRLLLRIKREEDLRFGCFIVDGRGPTFRHELLPSYKEQRLKMPEGLFKQIEPLLQAASLLGIPRYTTQESEADDCIASLAAQFKESAPVVIVGSDKDLRQCLDRNVVLWDPGQKTQKLTTVDGFQESEGLSPEQWPDFQALVGDKSDNIPGVPGIGPKTAKKLLGRFPSLDALKAGFDRLSAKEQEKLAPHLDDVFLYRRLTSLRTDLSQVGHLSELRCDPTDWAGLKSFLETYEFKSLLKELDLSDQPAVENAPRSQSFQARNQALPDLQGLELGLVPAGDGQFLLASEQEEYLVQGSPDQLLAALDQAATLIVPSYKDFLQISERFEELPLPRFFDLSLAAYLLNPEERDYSWPRLLQTYLSQVHVHHDNEGLAALHIGRLLRPRLEEAGLMELKYSVEMPLIPVLRRMEKRGLGIDLQAFDHFLQDVQNDIDRLSRTIFERAGREFNLRSPQQLAEVLFDDLGLRAGRKTPGGVPSTASAVLEGLQSQHPIIEDILAFRSLEKLRSTYLDPLPRQVWDDGRLHTHFNHLATATGRLSSSRPNLQNIPIRGSFGPRMRSCFVADSGCELIAADYSQIELRILAHLSGDEDLCEAFSRGEDIHTRTASILFDKSAGAVSSDERRKAKTINFGLLYGMGPQKLAREMGIGLKEAKSFIDIYFSRLSGVRQFFEQIEATARHQGFVTTLAGRRRLLPDIASRNTNLAEQSRRMAINTVVQGSAADIIKMAMVAVDTDQLLGQLQSRLILQVHDELLLESPRENVRRAGERSAELMSSVRQLIVPLTVEWGFGKNWSEAH
jgi:DNA polymerase-1